MVFLNVSGEAARPTGAETETRSRKKDGACPREAAGRRRFDRWARGGRRCPIPSGTRARLRRRPPSMDLRASRGTRRRWRGDALFLRGEHLRPTSTLFCRGSGGRKPPPSRRRGNDAPGRHLPTAFVEATVCGAVPCEGAPDEGATAGAWIDGATRAPARGVTERRCAALRGRGTRLRGGRSPARKRWRARGSAPCPGGGGSRGRRPRFGKQGDGRRWRWVGRAARVSAGDQRGGGSGLRRGVHAGGRQRVHESDQPATRVHTTPAERNPAHPGTERPRCFAADGLFLLLVDPRVDEVGSGLVECGVGFHRVPSFVWRHRDDEAA
jgi:hypothetical protein